MSEKQLFEAALGVAHPWYVSGTEFDVENRRLTIGIDFVAGSRFAHPEVPGEHPVHDTQTKRYRHLNFFQHDCFLEVRVPRLKLPDGRVALVESDWAGKLSGFTLLFEALVLTLCRQMPFAAVARMVGESWHRVHAICSRYVDLAVAELDLSQVTALAIDETSSQRGHRYLTLAADADQRKVVFVTPGRGSDTVAALADRLKPHQATPEQIESVSIDMSPAYIRGVADPLPEARITFGKFHVIAQACAALDKVRRQEQRTDPDPDPDPDLKGLRWSLLKDRDRLSAAQRSDLDVLIARATTQRTARAWLYREHLRDILDRKQTNVVSTLLRQWCTNVMRSKVEPMKDVARMIRRHFNGIVAWTRTRQTNGFPEALNGRFQAAKRKARGYGRFETMRTVFLLIAGKLDFLRLNPHAA